MSLAIQPDFFDQLRKQRGLSEDAFARACAISSERLQQLMEGATPTMLEFANIQLGFNRGDKGIPMILNNESENEVRSQKLVAQ